MSQASIHKYFGGGAGWAPPTGAAARQALLQHLLPCPVAGCIDRFKSDVGVKQHLAMRHKSYVTKDTAPLSVACAPIGDLKQAPAPSLVDPSYMDDDDDSNSAPKIASSSKPSEPVQTCGAKKRHRSSMLEKVAVLSRLKEYEAKELAAGRTPSAKGFSILEGVPEANLSRWKDQAEKLYRSAKDLRLRKQKGGGGRRHGALSAADEARLITNVLARRDIGLKVHTRWVRREAAKLAAAAAEKGLPAKSGRFGTSWAYRLRDKHNLANRTITNKRVTPLLQRVTTMQHWHFGLRSYLQSLEQRHRKWGNALPSQRYNVDQVPLPFVISCGTTWDRKGAKGVWSSTENERDEKRFATAIFCITPDGKQVRTSVIFRGKGTKLAKKETPLYCPRVPVFFQKNAWADRRVMLEWAKAVWLSGTGRTEHKLLFLDNLDAHTTDEFREYMRDKCNTTLFFGPPNLTEHWQPIDAGFGALVKRYYSSIQEQWLEQHGGEAGWSKMKPSERRVKITWWIDQATQQALAKVTEKSEEAAAKLDGTTAEKEAVKRSYCWRLFEKTGCLLTADGSDDALITPERFPSEYWKGLAHSSTSSTAAPQSSSVPAAPTSAAPPPITATAASHTSQAEPLISVTVSCADPTVAISGSFTYSRAAAPSPAVAPAMTASTLSSSSSSSSASAASASSSSSKESKSDDSRRFWAAGNITFNSLSINRLQPGCWLSDDEVWLGCCCVIDKHLKEHPRARVLFISPLLKAQKATVSRSEDLRRWCDDLLPSQVLQQDVIVMPCYYRHHWSLFVAYPSADPAKRQLLHADSLAPYHGVDCYEDIRSVLRAITSRPADEWPLTTVKSPRQPNSTDCGVYVCCNLEYTLSSKILPKQIRYQHSEVIAARLMLSEFVKALPLFNALTSKPTKRVNPLLLEAARHTVHVTPDDADAVSDTVVASLSASVFGQLYVPEAATDGYDAGSFFRERDTGFSDDDDEDEDDEAEEAAPKRQRKEKKLNQGDDSTSSDDEESEDDEAAGVADTECNDGDEDESDGDAFHQRDVLRLLTVHQQLNASTSSSSSSVADPGRDAVEAGTQQSVESSSQQSTRSHLQRTKRVNNRYGSNSQLMY